MSIVLSSVIIFLSSIIAGITGFGFGLISIPILVFLMPPQQVVPMMYLLALVLQLWVLWESRESLQFRRIMPLTVAGIIGIPLGTYGLIQLDPDWLRVIVGIVVIISTLAMMKEWNHPIRNEGPAFIFIGLLSGLLTGSTGIGGPPVTLFFLNQGTEKKAFRSNVTFYFTAVVLAAILSSLLGGLITRPVAMSAFVLLPSLLIGTWVGIQLSQRVDQARFRQLIVAILTLSGILAIATGVGLL